MVGCGLAAPQARPSAHCTRVHAARRTATRCCLPRHPNVTCPWPAWGQHTPHCIALHYNMTFSTFMLHSTKRKNPSQHCNCHKQAWGEASKQAGICRSMGSRCLACLFGKTPSGTVYVVQIWLGCTYEASLKQLWQGNASSTHNASSSDV
jgi:hypothetical protein